MSASGDVLLATALFVVGCPGSGTGLVGDILGAHGRVVYRDDPSDLATCRRRLLRSEISADDARAGHLDACGRWLSARTLSRTERLALRCPGHALVVPFLARAFPEARILHVLRDGRAVARSLLDAGDRKVLEASVARSPSAASPSGDQAGCGGTDWVPVSRCAEFEAATAAERAALTWAIHVRGGLEGRAVAPDRYFEIRYEDLCADPAGWGGRVLGFAGVEMERAVERVLDRIRSAAAEDRTRALGSEERALVEEKAGDLLHELGYDAPGPA